MKPLLHFLAETVLGLLAVAALAACALAIRLAHGPMDVTWLLRREPALLSASGASLQVGHASVAWPGTGHALAITASGITEHTDDGSLSVALGQVAVSLSVPQLLLGQVAPQTIGIQDGHATIRLSAGPGQNAAGDDARLPAWLGQLQGVQIHGVALTLQGALPGVDVTVPQADIALARQADGTASGTAQLVVAAGPARAAMEVRAVLNDGGARLTATTTPLSPAALSGLAPQLAGLSVLDAPVTLALQATLQDGFHVSSATLDVASGPGTLRAGRGSVALSSLAAKLTARPAELRLESLRATLTPGPHGPAPVVTATASATRAAGRLHAIFGLAIDSVAMADLARYWPEGTGGGARPWLVANVPDGRAHDARLSGSLDAAADLSDLRLTTLTGGLDADDITLFWLRPIPGLTHGRAHAVLQGPDALLVTMDRGGQNNLVLTPGSFIRMTGLTQKDQFSDIEIGLSGPLPDALGLLNHPRLHLLDRGGLQVVGAQGEATAKLSLHVPLDDRVTMDQIAINATASLTGVHLGRIAAGRDLDDGNLQLHVTGDGLSAGGTGAVAGIPAKLGLDMDFRAGPPGEIVQHVTASGSATAAQMRAAGAPDSVMHVLTAGQAGLTVDYAGLRGGTAALQIDSDLTQAALATPLGWSKPAGQPASLGGRVILEHGRLTGVDQLHAEGPDLAIVSRARLNGQQRTLLVDKLTIGETQAHGRIAFPQTPTAPIEVDLAGSMLDLSSQLDPPATPHPPPPQTDDTDDKPGQPWAARLDFAQLRLSRGKALAAFTLDAANDGLHITHAHVRAGTQAELAVDITPKPGGRTLAVSAADAGAALRALGVADNLAGGRLALDGAYDDTKPGAPLVGTATLTGFNLRSAPAIGRLLQAMTLYGLTDVLRGPGLHFSKMVAPFTWSRRVLHLANARAFSPSLGITAQGELDLHQHTANLTGTVVPAYFFNQLLGDIPLIGRIFSPEKGGGVFAARYSVRGKLGDPHVGVNPLSALTPGFLREGFGLFAPASRK